MALNSDMNKSGRRAADDKDDIKGRYVYDYPRPAMAADNVIFGFDGERLQVLLVERGIDPYKGCWALPGGFMRMNETVDECARRELREETNVRDAYLEQFHVFSKPDRDPRGRVVTVAFIALVRPEDHAVIGGDDASNAMWFDVESLPPLAFDHYHIVDMARAYLKEQLSIKPVAFQLLNPVFTVDELRKVYEVITGNVYDRRNFQRKLMQTRVVEDLTEPDCCESMPTECKCNMSCEDLADYDEMSRRKPKPRSRKLRFFRFNESRKPESESEDGSIKDLFNF